MLFAVQQSVSRGPYDDLLFELNSPLVLYAIDGVLDRHRADAQWPGHPGIRFSLAKWVSTSRSLTISSFDPGII